MLVMVLSCWSCCWCGRWYRRSAGAEPGRHQHLVDRLEHPAAGQRVGREVVDAHEGPVGERGDGGDPHREHGVADGAPHGLGDAGEGLGRPGDVAGAQVEGEGPDGVVQLVQPEVARHRGGSYARPVDRASGGTTGRRRTGGTIAHTSNRTNTRAP